MTIGARRENRPGALRGKRSELLTLLLCGFR